MQGHLFPIQIVNEEPAHFGTADLSRIGWDDQDRRYALKTLDDHPLLPVTEWVGYQLCLRLGIPTPEFAVVRRMNGQLALGSRWADDAIDLNIARLSMTAVARMLMDARRDMGAAFGLDAFLPNPDRRLVNFLFRRTTRTGTRALAFDWSRVDALHAPAFQRWPWGADCTSAETAVTLKKNGWLDEAEARRVAANLAAMPSTDLAAMLQSAPPEWTATLDMQAIMNWWDHSAPTRAQQSLSLL